MLIDGGAFVLGIAGAILKRRNGLAWRSARGLRAGPISPRLCSNFIELGYGIQVEPMMAQQFYNRSFEPFVPYKTINIEWFDLWNDPQNPSKGYKADWTGEDWYHSGYEHNPWFVAPGTGGRLPIDDKSTFIIEENSSLNATIRPEKEGGSGHGKQHLRVTNHEREKWAASARKGNSSSPERPINSAACSVPPASPSPPRSAFTPLATGANRLQQFR
jgi:hypothetical protein